MRTAGRKGGQAAAPPVCDMKLVWTNLLVAVMVLAGAALADDYTPMPKRFLACENKAGAGVFWVDSTNGRAWWADPAAMQWVYFGAPEGASSGPLGTFIPYENQSGAGLFVLNTATGEGWWTDGKAWNALGVPQAVKAPVKADGAHE